jgi:hypothetical protein
MSVVIFVDGVMRRERDQSIIMEGVALYKSLNETNRVILVCDDAERTDVWLKTNNLAKKLDDITAVIKTPLERPRLLTIETIRSKGKIDYVVTEDTELATQLLEAGIPVLVFLNPRYTRPEFRPDGREGRKSWDAINEELDRQQGLYDDDARLGDK